MNQSFLNKIASYFIQQYGTAISDFCFVFPSRRAGIFFKNHLSAITTQPIWAPKTLTINEFIEEFDEIKAADSITLLFKLYEVYQSIHESPLAFDEFISWGEMLLADFDDIDKSMVDAKQLFANLISLKEIDTDYTFLTDNQRDAIRSFWSTFNPEKLSEHQRSFIKNWETLLPIYTSFKTKLEQEKSAYYGMIVRKLADRIRDKETIDIPYKKVILCGFFVLTPAEKELFKYLKKIGIGEFYWDYSEFLMKDILKDNKIDTVQLPFHDPSYFLRENMMSFPPPTTWEQPFQTQLPKMTITGVSTQTEQLRLVAQFLEANGVDENNSPSSDDFSLNTAVVLTDENLLIPVLHSIPPSFDKINVTLGYPIKNSPIYSLIESIIKLQRNAKTTQQGKTWFYFRDVLPVIQHQYISAIDAETAETIKNKMLKTNSIFIEGSQLCSNDYFGLIFKKIELSSAIPDYISAILFQTYVLIKKNDSNFFEQEFVFALYKNVNQISDLLKKLDASIEPNTWLRLFKRITETQTLPFKGEPLSGLQIMGILETRVLDFENLIILNMNEGVFPKNSVPNSFVPYNLRQAFGLSTIEHQDAIFSYYFFRLIHRAKKVHLVFNSSADDMQSGEMSRFLYQLIYEHPIKPELFTAVDQVKIYKIPTVYTQKTDAVMAILEQYKVPDGKKLSPSALSGYIECPQKFAYAQIHKIKEPNEITEDLDARIFGILFHSCMETLYQPWIGKTVTADDFLALSKNSDAIKAALLDAFQKEFSEISFNTDDFSHLQGKNILVYEVLFNYIQKFIENETHNAPIKIVGLEQNVLGTITIDQSITVHIGGIIDRIDETSAGTRVIDYKTGSGEATVSELPNLFKEDKHAKYKAIFQTLLYAAILKQNGTKGHINPNVVWLKNLFKTVDYSLQLGSRNGKQTLEYNLVELEFGELLKQLLTDLFNPDLPFHQTSNTESCKYCSYKSLCNKN